MLPPHRCRNSKPKGIVMALVVGMVCLAIGIPFVWALVMSRSLAAWMVARKLDGVAAVAATTLLTVGVVGIVMGLATGSVTEPA